MRRTVAVILSFLASAVLWAQQDVISFDRTVHDFGDILLSDGPVSCTFHFRNVGNKPLVIHQIASSCGCTTPVWTREPVLPGHSGKIDVTFSNDQGPYPFEKSLTVYVSGRNRPAVLKIKGQSFEKKQPLEETYTVRIGILGLRQGSFSIGYIDKGTVKEDEAKIANLSGRAVLVEPLDVTEGLTVSISPNPVPAKSSARLIYSVDTRKMKADAWGRQTFEAGFSVDGKRQNGKLTVKGVIKDNFSSLTEAQIEKAGTPVVEKIYWEFGTVGKGCGVDATFRIVNKGSEPLVIHKVDTRSDALKVVSRTPFTIKSGKSAVVKVHLDTSSLEGEVVEVLTLVTDSPAKPLVNLFVTGIVQK